MKELYIIGTGLVPIMKELYIHVWLQRSEVWCTLFLHEYHQKHDVHVTMCSYLDAFKISM